MNQKILMINGSPRKKHTYNILLQVGEILKNHNIEFEIINLTDYNLKNCAGCDITCINNKGCNTKDDMPILLQKIMESDGLVFASPVYLNGVTSLFKNFADRTNTWVHNPAPAGKPVLSVATTAATGLKQTKQFLESFAVGFGGRKGDFISRSNKNINLAVKEKELSRFLSLLKIDKRKYRPSIKEIVMFEVQKVMAIKFGGGNREFWEEKAWLNKYYYYECKIGFGKKIFAKMMFKILSKAIKI